MMIPLIDHGITFDFVYTIVTMDLPFFLSRFHYKLLLKEDPGPTVADPTFTMKHQL